VSSATSLGRFLTCCKNAALKIWRNVCKEYVFGVRVLLRQFRIEIGENVQLGRDGDALIEILQITTGPEKAFARSSLESSGVNTATTKNGLVLFRKVVAYDADEIYV